MISNSRRPPTSGESPKPNRPSTGSGSDVRLLGRYRVLRSLGSGGMSEVYLAYDPKRGSQVAVKVLAEHLAANHTVVNRFLQEGKLSKELDHPQIVKAFDAGRDKVSGRYFITMEFVDGPTAQARLDAEGRMPLIAAVQIVIDIALGLEHLHFQRFVHRDVKPGNILITPDGRAKLADLGVAKVLDNDSSLTTLDQNVGTPYYMPWEQGLNSSMVDARSDLFALGATLYHLATGHVPFPGQDEEEISQAKALGIYLPAREHDPQLPAILDLILERMLARDPRKRFTTARDVVEVLSASGLADGRTASLSELEFLVPQPLAPTRADLASQAEVDTPLEPTEEQIWQVKFQREDGSWRRVHGRTADIIHKYERGELPENLYAARDQSPVFRRIRAYPQFRNLVYNRRGKRADRPTSSPAPRRRQMSAGPRWQWLDYVRGMVLTSFVAMLIACSVIVYRLFAMHH